MLSPIQRSGKKAVCVMSKVRAKGGPSEKKKKGRAHTSGQKLGEDLVVGVEEGDGSVIVKGGFVPLLMDEDNGARAL